MSRSVSRSTVVDATPEQVFDLLADPRQHPGLDGSGSVREAVSGPERLALGSRFGMRMRLGLPYVISNTVVEFETDRLIAWRHFFGHRWRFELAPVDGGTRVTETFDWSTATFPPLIELSGFPARNATGIERTLERLPAVLAERAAEGQELGSS